MVTIDGKEFSLPGSIGKYCKKCGTDHWMYMKWKDSVDGRRCVKCTVKHTMAWKKRHPGRSREQNWKDRGIIGMTVSRYHSMFSDQKKSCAICQRSRTDLVVDHCHKTGEVRGLLCKRRNSLAQDPDILLSILEYMKGGRIQDGASV